jgi:alpha-D-xyloside xylohydrolase
MRALFLEFPHDAQAAAIADQYLFGPDLLVAPVLEPAAAKRTVYLPAGATWTDAWTGHAYPGGGEVTVPAPLERIPLLLRDDARLPVI